MAEGRQFIGPQRGSPCHLFNDPLTVLETDDPAGVFWVHRVGAGIVLAQDLGTEKVLYPRSVTPSVSVAHAEKLRRVGVAVNIPRSTSPSTYNYV